MNENIKKFTTQLAADPALAEKMGQIQTQYVKSLVALAKEAGYELSEEDFTPKNEPLSEEEKLTDDELGKVAGGSADYSTMTEKELKRKLSSLKSMSFIPFYGMEVAFPEVKKIEAELHGRQEK